MARARVKDMLKGKFGAYCKNKFGMNVSWAMEAPRTIPIAKTGKKSKVHNIKTRADSITEQSEATLMQM